MKEAAMRVLKLLLGVIIFAALFSACYTEQRFTRHIGKGAVRYPHVLARSCNTMYPPKTETKTEIIYKEGKNDTIYEDLYIDCDTISETIYKDRIVKVPYVKTIIQRDTLYKSITESVESQAAAAICKHEKDSITNDLNAANIQTEKTQQSKKSWMIACLALAAIFLAQIIYKVIKYKVKIFG